MTNFGLKLQVLRKKAAMSQADLASLLKVSRQAISKWERAEGLPDLFNIKKIAEVFNITIDELLDIEIKPNDNKKEKTNKISLAFLTIPGVVLGVLSLILITSIIIKVII